MFGREAGNLVEYIKSLPTGKLPEKNKQKKKSKQGFLSWFDLFRLALFSFHKFLQQLFLVVR